MYCFQPFWSRDKVNGCLDKGPSVNTDICEKTKTCHIFSTPLPPSKTNMYVWYAWTDIFLKARYTYNVWPYMHAFHGPFL